MPLTVLGQNEKVSRYGVDSSFTVPKGLAVGDTAPTFTTTDVNGKGISLNQLKEKGPVVILFYRGQWCPVCSRYLSNLNDSIQLLIDREATVIAVGPETVENAQRMKKSTGSDFSFIADTSLEIHRSYDVLFYVTKKYQMKIKKYLRTDIAENNGGDTAMLPVPATFVIDKAGKIVFKQFDYNYKNRASVQHILNHL